MQPTLIAIVIMPDNTCIQLTPNYTSMREGETEEQFIERAVSTAHPSHSKYILRQASNLPQGYIEEWQYNPITDQIDHVPIPAMHIDWESLKQTISSISPTVKDKLDVWYPRFHQGITDQDADYVVSTYLALHGDVSNGTTQQTKDAIKAHLTNAGLDIPD